MTNSTPHPSARQSKILLWTGLFLAAYLCASFLDLWTTEIALLNPEAREGNVAATTDGAYNSSKAWLITAAGGLFLCYIFMFALRNAPAVSNHWLQHPVRALHRLSILPWIDRDKGRGALNGMSYALAFPLLRVAAAVNNAMIGYGAEGFLSYAISSLAKFMPAIAATVMVVLVAYFLLAMLVAPLAKRIIIAARQ